MTELDGLISFLKGQEGTKVTPERSFTIQAQKMFRTNARAAIQVVHIGIESYFRQKSHASYSYELTEYMMRGNEQLPPSPTRFIKDNEGYFADEGAGGSVYDSKFLPNIFFMPYCTKSEGFCNDDYYNGLPLIGLRVLQLMKRLHGQVKSDSAIGSPLSRTDIAVLIEVLFGIEWKHTFAVIDEFTESEILIMTHSNDAQYGPLDGLILGPKGHSILEEYAFDPTYLSICAIVFPIPKAFCFLGAPIKFISAPIPVSYKGSFVEYVASKLTNSIALAKIILSMSHRQRTVFKNQKEKIKSKIEQLSHPLDEYAKMVISDSENFFDFETHLEQRLKNTWQAALSGVVNERSSPIFAVISGMGCG